MALDPNSQVRKSIVSVLQNVGASRTGRGIVLESISSRFDEIKFLTNGVVAFRDIVATLSLYLTKEDDKTYLENWMDDKKNELIVIQENLNSSLKVIESNIKWVDNYYNDMNAWFEQHMF
ncbi:unnamed protein product [Allacma fusca]|uniref:Uncharacterized protein n=1 Tax=Allacma fusca TaxID=39272 RepID=A0A8J2LAV2_9HEXA|nr:unnamed protein product [Allacma fusca]